jgi:hypothetical protein
MIRPRVIVSDELLPPSLSRELTQRVAAARPVALRRPGRELAVALFGLGIWAALVIAAFGLRLDLPELPSLRFAAGAIAWVAFVLYGATRLTMPRSGQVLPSSSAARTVALVLPPLSAALAAILLVDAPGLTRHPVGEAALHFVLHCLSIGLVVAAVPLIILVVGVRARLWSATGWMGAVTGVLTGSLGALVLHFICPIGGALHMLLGHCGVLFAGALLGAGVARAAARRS